MMTTTSSNTLTCKSRQFKALMATQFLGAYNDNFFKTVVSLMVVNLVASKEQASLYLSLIAGFFVLPYILFSAYSGYLSDRFAKSNVIKATKLLEVLIMSLAFIGFKFEILWLLTLCIFLMGAQSALFSPSKYGILPELLPIEELSRANGYLNFYTFLAIILGTGTAGFFTRNQYLNPAQATLIVAVVGLMFSLLVGSVPTHKSKKPFVLNPLSPNLKVLAQIKTQKGLWLAVLGITYFWFLGAFFQLNVLVYAKEALQIDDRLTGFLLAALGIGIGVGSITAGKVSEGKVELGLVPIGSFGLTIFSCLLYFTSFNYFLTLATVATLGAFAGLFIVPLSSYLQEHSPIEMRGSYIASSNFMTFVVMLLASFLFWAFRSLIHLSPSQIFVALSLATLCMSIFLFTLLPELLVRCVNWILLHIFYRINRHDLNNVPDQGGALIVCNHVSYLDAQILSASIKRSVRFIMYRPIYEHILINPIVKATGAIPISPDDGKDKIQETLSFAAKCIQSGELVAVFAEGKISRDGEISDFRPGFESIMKEACNAPIIPVYIGGMWGSIFSFSKGKVFFKLPKKIPYPVHVFFGNHLPATLSASVVQENISKMHNHFSSNFS